MKILLINDYFSGGGAEGVFRTTLQLLRDKKYDVDFFVGNKEIKRPKSLWSYLYNKEIANLLSVKLEAFKPNIIHIHNYYHYLSPSIFIAIKKFKKNNASKVVFTAHDYHLICPSSGMMIHQKNKVLPISITKNSFKYLLFKKIDHRGLKYDLVKKIQWFWAIKILKISNQIDVVVSPSYFLKKAFESSLFKVPIVVVRNPFNLTCTNINELNKNKDKLKLLYIGRLSREKGLLEFLKAIKKNNINNITINILGTGECLQEIKNYIAINKLDYIKLHGYKTGKELLRFLKQSNVLVLPSVWYENAPLSIIEGAIYGNIILSSNLGGIRELTELTKNHILIDNWEDEIKLALDKIKAMGSNYVLKSQEFSAENYYININKLYKN